LDYILLFDVVMQFASKDIVISSAQNFETFISPFLASFYWGGMCIAGKEQ
jgi:hypothetical protein